MSSEHPLLSICIPTYNRAGFLSTSLERFLQGITSDMDIELLISDNCSSDETPEVVKSAMTDGLKWTYIRNEYNIGPDGNFLQCFRKAKGKYIWLCGDDDFLIPERLKHLYDILVSGEYGLIELNMDKNKQVLEPKIYDDSGVFLSEIHVWITFMSGNIFRKEVVDTINGERYNGTNLIQVPYFLASATLGLPNVMYYPQVLEVAADGANNGGYNLFQVFCENLLTIFHEKVEEGKLTEKQFQRIKKSVFCKWMISFYSRFFFDHDYGNFKMENAKEILHKWYGEEPYYYRAIAKQWIKHFIRIIIHKHN